MIAPSNGSRLNPGHKIIVADDEPILRRTFAYVLREHGHDVWTAEDGHEAVALCREIQPDLVLTDILMPGQDGFTTIMELKSVLPEVRIIAMSAALGPAAWAVCQQIGADLCLAKPVDAACLVRAIDGLLAAERDAGGCGQSAPK